MGKPTGFLDDSRRDTAVRPALERIKDWEPFHLPLSSEERQVQGGRCMNCGVPYCQTGMDWEVKTFGCPLHNLIPEWNDMVYAGNLSHALTRLLKTNNFPEFTARVCPAPCEGACICGIYGDSVTIRDNELAIIEDAFERSVFDNFNAPAASGQSVAVVGAGPAGLACADQLNKRGHKVTVIERDSFPGGLLTYGIPNMKLPKDVVARRVRLMERQGVTFLTNTNAADKAVAASLVRDYDAVVLCCGTEKPRPLALETEGVRGVYVATDYLKASVERQQFGLDAAIPTALGRDVVVIGTGDTASDCVSTALRQGCASVVQLVRREEGDYLVNGVLPVGDAQEEAIATTGHDPRQFGVQVKELVVDESGELTAIITTLGDNLPCTLLIAATGFLGCKDDVCEAFGVAYGHTVETAEDSYATNVEKVFAAGDMRRGQSLVVWAISEGRGAAREVDAFLNGYTNLK